jgi:hypothetical protein
VPCGLAGLRQSGGRQSEILQAEDRGKQLVQARGAAEECFQLAVRDERAVVGEGRDPVQAFDAGLFLGRDLHHYRGPGEIRARRLFSLHLGWPGAFDDELCRNPRLVRAVHAAPALFPDGRQLSQRRQVPAEQHFERLGKLDLPLPLRPTTRVSPGRGATVNGTAYSWNADTLLQPQFKSTDPEASDSQTTNAIIAAILLGIAGAAMIAFPQELPPHPA